MTVSVILVVLLGVLVLSYLIGSIPTGYLLVKAVKGIDIRKEGSGSTGATNVKRVLGTKAFFTVMLLDLIKGLLPVLVAKYVESKTGVLLDLHILPILAAFGVVIGHSKSIFLGFTGGKSVASGVGTIFGLYWPVGTIVAVVWSIITYGTKYVSAGSIIALLIAPILMFLFKQPLSYVAYCFIGATYITLYLHRSNIKRLIEGKENKVRD